ncbi:MAG TPA: hypothetical protein VK570_20155, partial [Rubrivivax sp.]|nr:hypothetical protein [Rubrivivax sp.]
MDHKSSLRVAATSAAASARTPETNAAPTPANASDDKMLPTRAAAPRFFSLAEPLRFEGPKFKPTAGRPLGYRWY